MMEKKALVIGAARSGIAAAGFLGRNGWTVTLSDLMAPDFSLSLPSSVKTSWAPQQSDLLENVELVVVSPGVPSDIPILKKAQELKIEVIGELELFYQNCPLPILAVTGTNGKTTTVSLLEGMMKTSNLPVLLGGNIGRALSEEADNLPSSGWVVLEVSSYQLESTKCFRPHIGAILNLTPDHLERHKTFSAYQEAKEKIFANQTGQDFLVLNHEDPLVKEMATRSQSKVVFFSLNVPLTEGIWGDEKSLYWSWAGITEKVLDWAEVKLLGNHNRENIAAAGAIALLSGVTLQQVARIATTFQGVEHRIEWIRDLDGVSYYNDSKATNPESAIKALDSFSSPLIWLAGGYDKGTDLLPMMNLAKEKVKEAIFFGAGAERFSEAARKAGLLQVKQVADLPSALKQAKISSEVGDTILLSPACASFDQFSNYEERGILFKEWVREL